MNGIQSNSHTIGTYNINKIYFVKMINIYLKMDIVSCHVFVNLLVDLIKITTAKKNNLFIYSV